MISLVVFNYSAILSQYSPGHASKRAPPPKIESKGDPGTIDYIYVHKWLYGSTNSKVLSNIRKNFRKFYIEAILSV
jgi:hypothetical protein